MPPVVVDREEAVKSQRRYADVVDQHVHPVAGPVQTASWVQNGQLGADGQLRAGFDENADEL